MLLQPEALRSPLRACGYRRDLLRANFASGDATAVPLVGFAQLPTDARSACVAVLGEHGDARAAVEACRPLGAPLIFVCHENTLQWWKQGTRSAEWLRTISANDVDRFLQDHHDEFSPEAVYRAKTIGRLRREYQLEFVDLGLMPLLEQEVGTALSRLLERTVSELKERLGWDDVTPEKGHWLLQTVFWLLSGKILRDKRVSTFEDLDLSDVEDVFHRVANHYGTRPLRRSSAKQLEALRSSASLIDQFSSLALTTTESLAYVYENTLISKATRSSLGTHSTPSYLVDYIVGLLADWIEEIPERERSVFEPACGHAAFLVAAMRLLSHLLPPAKSAPSRRGPYLRSRLHGSDLDPFSLELARLSLTLTDIPNPDGWDLRAEDMYLGDRLADQTRKNTILLANPPFGSFDEKELRAYDRTGTDIGVNNKAAEMLRRALPALQPGSVFGLVLPQAVLHKAYAEGVRRSLLDGFELREVSLFPDKVFSFSDAECAVVIGRRKKSGRASSTTLRFRRIRERQMAAFRETYAAPASRVVPQSRFNKAVRWDMRVPDQEQLWTALRPNPRASDLADFGMGLIYHGKDLPPGVATYSKDRFAGSREGFVRLGRRLQIHELPELFWMNLADEAIVWRRSGATTGVPQILLNYVPTSRGPWRLKAVIDAIGRPVTSAFLTIRPHSCSLQVLWALLNSPIANAFAFCHLGKRHNIKGTMAQARCRVARASTLSRPPHRRTSTPLWRVPARAN